MSLFGAMQSGISGMAAQSSAMAAVADNISNVNTVGYKGNSVVFQTLVTKQTSTTSYSPGGVQPVNRQGVNVQGLLAANSSSTAMGISGNGYFIVNQAANPGEGDMWAYTRAGDFNVDHNGDLQNSGGFYAQGWTLVPWDGNPNASIVDVGGINYMKAYNDANGDTVYINDNIVDKDNLRPVNISNIGGTASPTQQLGFGANLPAGDSVFDPSNPTGTGRHSVSALIYDSLGSASNVSMTYTKDSANSWGMSASVPDGAANMVLYGGLEKSDGGEKDVYYSAGQLEFTKIPSNGSTISITDEASGEVFTFEFTDNPESAKEGNHVVDLSSSIVSAGDFAKAFAEKIQSVMPGANRFTAEGNTVNIVQSVAGSALSIDASKTLACVQSAVNPVHETGIPSGIFEIPAIDDDIKNCARIDFVSSDLADYVDPANPKSIVIDGKTFTFTNKGVPEVTAPAIAVDIADAIVEGTVVDPAKIVSALNLVIKANITEPERFNASGSSLEILPSHSGDDIVMDTTGLGTAIDGVVRDKEKGWISIQNNGNAVLSNKFTVNNTDIESGAMVPSVRFNADGTPKYFFVDEMAIDWANGAENMSGEYKEGTTIKLDMGNPGTGEGITSLSGNFTTNFVKQDGAKFGAYAGVTIDENGIVTALFDNGERRPIAMMPLATFSNPNGLSSLTGNSWIETAGSGQALLKQAGTNGAGLVASNALEQSTVDLATEFSNMIITQRAYSASTKIITTADEMLDELTRLV